MLIDLTAARQALSPYLTGIYLIVIEALKEYESEVSEKGRAKACSRSKASLIHNFIIDGATRLEQKDCTIRVVEIKKMYVMVITPVGFNGCFAIRFKKLDSDGKSSNQQTKQVRDFKAQKELPHMPASHHLEVGYVMDKFGMKLQSVNWACPNGNKVYWHEEMITASTENNVYDLFQDEGQFKEPAPQSESVVNIRLKGADKGESIKEESLDDGIVRKKGTKKTEGNNEQSNTHEGTGTDKS